MMPYIKVLKILVLIMMLKEMMIMLINLTIVMRTLLSFLKLIYVLFNYLINVNSDLIDSSVSDKGENNNLHSELKVEETVLKGAEERLDSRNAVSKKGENNDLVRKPKVEDKGALEGAEDEVDSSNSSHIEIVDAISVDSDSHDVDSKKVEDAPLFPDKIENVLVNDIKLDKKEQEFWGETGENEGESNSEDVENEWEVGEYDKWEDVPGDKDVRVKPQRSRKSFHATMETNNSPDYLDDDSIIKVVHTESNKLCNTDDTNDDSFVDANADLEVDFTDTDKGALSESNLISDKLDNDVGKSEEVAINDVVRNEYSNKNIDEDNSFLTENIISTSKCDISFSIVQQTVEMSSSLKLLKESTTDCESSDTSSMNVNDCDYVVDSTKVQDFDVENNDVIVDDKHTENVNLETCVVNNGEFDLLEDETVIYPEKKSDNTLQDEEEKNDIPEIPDFPSDKGESAPETSKKKSCKRNKKKKVQFLNSADQELFKTADWSSFPLISGEPSTASTYGRDGHTDKVTNSVGTMTSVKYFNIVSYLNQGGFIDGDIKYLTGNSKTLVKSLTVDTNTQKASKGPSELCYFEKSTSTADLVTLEEDSDGLEFLKTCFSAVPDEELEYVLEICSNNVTWAKNVLLDWGYSSELTKQNKKKFSVKLSESVDSKDEEIKKGPSSLIDLGFGLIENENITNGAGIKSQLIKTGKDRLDTIENDNMCIIKFNRSLSTGYSPGEKHRSKVKKSSDSSKNLLRLNLAEPVVNLPEKKEPALDVKPDSSVKPVNVDLYNGQGREDISEDTKVSITQEMVDGAVSDETISDTIDIDTSSEWSMMMAMNPEMTMQLEDMFGSLNRHTDDEEYARKLQNEEDSYRKPESSERSNGTRSRRVVPLIGYSVKGTIPTSPIKPVAWTHSKQSLAEIMKEQQTIQDKQNQWKKLLEEEGAHLVMSTRLKRQKLYEAFPKVDKTQLDEIFQASCFNLTETIEAVTTSLVEGPKVSSNTIIDQDSDQKLLEAAKQRSIEDMLDQYNYDGNIASKDYQDGMDPEYEDYRGKANLHHRLRQECFMKAREAYRRGLKQVASFYSQQGHQHTHKLKEANMRASQQILAKRNNDIETKMILDLCGLHKDEVKEALDKIIPQKERDRCKQLTVITGRGSRSKGGVAILRPYVIDYLNKSKYNYVEVSTGVFKVSFKYRSPDL